MGYYDEVLGKRKTYDTTFMSKVYGWMSLALALTGAIAMYVATSTDFVTAIVGNKWLFIGLLLFEVVLVLILVANIENFNFQTAFFLFFVYAALNGVTFSIIFLAYTSASVATTFFITAGTFGFMSIYGLTTKSDLSGWGNMLFMALVGLIIASIANMFIGSSTMDYIISFIGVIVFVAYTAYDTQKIKNSSYAGEKAALLGALTLYLDFVNLFLYLLRFLGDRK